MRRDLNLALSLDHAHDPKLTFVEDEDATKILPKMLILTMAIRMQIGNKGDTRYCREMVQQVALSHFVGTSKKSECLGV